MAKSKRSKVKMAYKAMRRSVMEPRQDAQLREQAAKVYKAIGLPLPEERTSEERMKPRTHGGGELVSTFIPTAKGPKLNVVHGPNAVDDSMMKLTKDVIGFPIVGAGARARMRAEMPVPQKKVKAMDVDGEEFEDVDAKPYFYPRRARKSGGIKKGSKRREKSLKAAKKPKKMVVEAASA